MEVPARTARATTCDACREIIREEKGALYIAAKRKVTEQMFRERGLEPPPVNASGATKGLIGLVRAESGLTGGPVEMIKHIRAKRQRGEKLSPLEEEFYAARRAKKAGPGHVVAVAKTATRVAEIKAVVKERTAQEAAQQELALRELARRRLMPFILRNQPSYTPGWVHREICAELEAFSLAVERKESPRLMIWVPPRHGKLVADSTPVLTPSGWTTHGALAVGDYVFGPDGLPTEVVGRSAADFACLEVRTSHGAAVKVHPAHEWTVYDYRSKRLMTVETQELAALGVRELTRTSDGSQRQRFRYQLPAVAALQFDDKPLPLEPYTLGAWLGDGSSKEPMITHAHGEGEVVAAISGEGRYRAVTTQCLGGQRTRFNGGLATTLRKMGLYGAKHIPEIYKRGSVQQRLQLLAGLIDTDGSVEPSGRVRVTNINARLAGDVLELVRTLGWRAGVLSEPARRARTTGFAGRSAVYTVHFAPDSEIPTRLPRKAVVPKNRRSANAIISVKPCAPEIGHCIQVAREDGLYLVGKHLTPTHNSMIASWHFPPWHLGRNPHHEVIACSYAASLAMGFSRKARALVQDEDFRKIFPKCRLNKDVLNAENWQTTEGGGYRAAGVGGPMTGTGAHVLIIDDPVKNWEEADSETVRQSTHEWYASTAYTRLAPGGGVLIIQTRWHEDDLSGRLAATQIENIYADQFKIIDYPALALQDEKYRKQGEALHPERYDADALKRYEENVGPRVWNALYQQRPAPDEGAYFKRDYFKYYGISQLPTGLDYFVSWDLAITAKEDNDPTCGFVVGVDSGGRWWIVDRIYGRWTTYDIVENIIRTMQRYDPSVTWIEKDKVAMAIGPILERTMQDRRIRNYVEEVPVGRRDKVQRARTLQGLLQQGLVYIPLEAPWLADFESEMLKFPHAKHDDQVDSLSHMANQLAVMGGMRPLQPTRAQPISWKDKLGALMTTRSGRKSSYLSQ